MLELVKEWMIIVLEFGKEVDDHFNAYLITNNNYFNTSLYFF